MTKPSDPSLPVAGDSTPTTICNQCKSAPTPFLHYIKHRGIFRRLCTSCILRFNSQLFCPVCFILYNPTSPIQDSTTPCSKCHSISHTSCITSNPSEIKIRPDGSVANNGYVCCLCVSGSIFRRESNGNVFDRRSAAALLAAAKISYESMSKAKMVAKGEAEKRSKEAWSTKKRAREAIEHVASVEERVKMEGNLGFDGGVGRNVGERNVFGVDRVDNSSAVLASLNAVELNEKEKVGGENGGGFGRQVVQVVDEKPVAILGPYVQNNHLRDGNGGSFQ